ncbi:MAG: HDOD domain-containing protein [candidate division Zixibacteria bacterium]|nr:HDOD domain-containing protein [candidate division Zixibacteria bacterium]
MSKDRILFVDNPLMTIRNNPQTVNSLQDKWDLEIVGSGAEALKALQEHSFQVIVSEMITSDMNADQLLKEVSELYPGIVRFILSSCADKRLIMKTMEYVHQFIAKPCDPNTLRKIINNSIDMRSILKSDGIFNTISSIKSLPSPPKIFKQLAVELQSQDVSIHKVADLIKQDVSITVKLLQMINSAFFGLKAHIQNPLHAINLLGLDTVKSLVLAVGAFNQFDDPKVPGFSIESIYNRSVSISACARTYATILGLPHSEDALIAGMLHDVGKLVMLTHFKTAFSESIKLAKSNSIPLYQAQIEILDVSDAEIGAYLLSLWGLSDSILEAVALHYMPHKMPSPMINVLTTVHLAYAIDYDKQNNIQDDENSALDMEYLTKLNLTNQISNLRNFSMAAVS